MSSTTRWRKKPVTVDAIRNEGEWAPILAWLDACGYTVPFLGRPVITRSQDGSLSIATLEGEMRADVGDWVIRGVKGEFYPCKDDIFRQTYEPSDGAEDRAAVRAVAEVSPGRAAYEAYVIASDGKSLISGAPLPAWYDLRPDIREAWRAAADGAIMLHTAEYRPEAELEAQRDEARAMLRGVRDILLEDGQDHLAARRRAIAVIDARPEVTR